MNIITLDAAKEGTTVIVDALPASGWARRLYQMGIIPGAKLEVVFNRGKGPVIVRLGDVEISIGRGLARKIIVRSG